jgi:hypothetical protein
MSGLVNELGSLLGLISRYHSFRLLANIKRIMLHENTTAYSGYKVFGNYISFAIINTVLPNSVVPAF